MIMAAIARCFRHTICHYSSYANAIVKPKKQDTNVPLKLHKYSWRAPKYIESEDRAPPTQARGTYGKKQKPPYKPPSSLDRDGQSPLHSDLPFDFQFSYTETPQIVPLGFREPKFSPFGPDRLDREWTGWRAPAKNTAVTSVDGNDEPIQPTSNRFRDQLLGEPLTKEEIRVLVEKNLRGSTSRQVNLGRDGLTHNMLNDIHNHWKRAPAVRVKCMGVATVDMKNVCFHLEDKTGGKIIYRNSGVIILFRGRHYKPKERPAIPLMLWKPHEPVYPRLIKTAVDGLTVEETKNMRKRGLNTPALTKLKKNGVYCELVRKVQEAFKENELVRIDCKGLATSDYKKIGAKLRDLVPCILLTFEKEQIVIWRGKNASFVKASSLQSSGIIKVDKTNSLMLVKKSPLVPLEIFSECFSPSRVQSVAT